MRKVDASTLIFAGVSILYPLVAALGVRVLGPGWVLAGLFILILLRAAPAIRSRVPGALTWGLLGAAALVALVALYDQALSVRLYPALMNAAMLMSFALSLWRGPSMIERFAPLLDPHYDERDAPYARTVTWVWCGFFVINGAASIWTALYADWNTWAIYNGIIAYAAMGALFLGEMLIRPRFLVRSKR